jgi:hypothetical protein
MLFCFGRLRLVVADTFDSYPLERRMIGDAAQHEQLARLYGEFGDEELLALGRKITDLTDVAQEVLKREISRRGLSISPETVTAATTVLDEREAAELWKYAGLAPPECVFEFGEGDVASAARMTLAEAGIESVAVPHQEAKYELRGPRLVVAPEDAERAAFILAQPTVEKLKGDAEAMMAEEFHEPVCPACGAEESVLESVEPANRWRCDACGEVWMEDESFPKA